MADADPDRRPGPDPWGPITTHEIPGEPGGATAIIPALEPALLPGEPALPPGEPAPPPGEPPPPPSEPALLPPTDELPLRQRVRRKVKRGDKVDAVRDAVSTLEAHLHPDFRVAMVAGVLALTAISVQAGLGGVHDSSRTIRGISYALAFAFLVLGVFAVRRSANEVARVSGSRGGPAASQVLRVVILLVGYLLIGLVFLDRIGISLGNLLVGGALTGVILGIAAQQVLGNLFAGLVLLFTRPYVPGERIRVATGALGGPHDGVVVNVGLVYTTLLTVDGPLNLPNSGLLASAIGPVPVADAEAADEPDPADRSPQARDSSAPPGRGGAATTGPVP